MKFDTFTVSLNVLRVSRWSVIQACQLAIRSKLFYSEADLHVVSSIRALAYAAKASVFNSCRALFNLRLTPMTSVSKSYRQTRTRTFTLRSLYLPLHATLSSLRGRP